MRKLWALALCVGCGSSSNSGLPDMAQPAALTLIESDYQLKAGQEQYLCARKTISEELWITEITPVNGEATHHEVLAVDKSHKSPDGIADCGSNIELDVIGWDLLFASGVASPSLKIPDGAALHVPAGSQIVMQMHLLNATQAAVDSHAAISVKTLPPGAATPMQAQMLLAGPLSDSRVTSDIPVGAGQVVSGQCTIKSAVNYFAVFPHMHQIGTHIKVDVTAAGATQTLYDHDYSFNNQDFAEFTPIALAQGDKISVTCTYDNETGAPVKFGQSSYNEMCYAISYVYPPMTLGSFGAFCAN